MTQFDKPDLTRGWGAGALPANVVDPDVADPGKYNTGWIAEIPPFEYFNFLQKSWSEGLGHINQQGIGVWDTDTEYPIGGTAKGSDGNWYTAKVLQSGNDPVGDLVNWENFSIRGIDNSGLTSTQLTMDDDQASFAGAVIKDGTHPKVLAFQSSSNPNVTGNGDPFQLTFNSEILDQSNDFNAATGVLTVSIPGTYTIMAYSRLNGELASHTSGTMTVVTTGRAWSGDSHNPFANMAIGSNRPILRTFAKVDVGIGDTIAVSVNVGNGTKVVDIDGIPTNPSVWISIELD